MQWLALAFAYSGFAALCLAMDKYQLAVARETACQQRARALGWCLLGVSLALCVAGSGWGIGIVLWLGALTAGAAVIALWLLPYRPAAIVPSAWLLPLAGGLAWLLG